MQTASLFSAIQPQSTQMLFVPFTLLYNLDPEFNQPYLKEFIDTVARYSFVTIADAILSYYYSNNGVWDESVKNSVGIFVNSKLFNELQVVIKEHIDELYSYNPSAAINALSTFDYEDGVLENYIITSISTQAFHSLVYTMPFFLTQGFSLGLGYEFDDLSLINNEARLSFRIVTGKINDMIITGAADALQYYNGTSIQ